MNTALLTKLDRLHERLEELNGLLAEPETARDPARYRGLAREHAELRPLVEEYRQYRDTLLRIEEAGELLSESEGEMKALAQQELDDAEETAAAASSTLCAGC